jgi:N-acylglucosamine 2-epimerase
VVNNLDSIYRSALLDDVVPFWLKHSPDPLHGGYFTCLDRDGSVYDTDKFVWLQARQVWTFSMLYEMVERRAQWLETARAGADFLRSHGMNDAGDWFFSLNREGHPLVQPYNIFSDCFAAMAFARFASAAEDEDAARIAVRTYHRIIARAGDPKGPYEKTVPGTRPRKGFALPMILCNLAIEMEHLLPPDVVEEQIDSAVSEVMEIFVDDGTLLIPETVGPDGERIDSFDGRLMNPGHAIEAMWFVMDIGRRRADRGLIRRAVDVTIASAEYGWDREFGGIFAFMDRLGHPPEKLEWDQKLWWVHLETLVACAMGYALTADERCARWFHKVHEYTWQRFPDPGHGEWWGYLTRRGDVLLPLKGGKWKGCFHVPRGLFQCWQILSSPEGSGIA